MTIAFVLGNGKSRLSIDNNFLAARGLVYGCNALYREFTPTVLVSTDRPISTAIQESGYALKNRLYTRRPIENLGAKKVPEKYYGYSSGPIAAAIAAQDGCRQIYLIGFDLGGIDNYFNNIYADTEFYKPSNSSPTYSGNWIKQLSQIANDFPKHRFCRVMGDFTQPVAEFEKLPNFEIVDVEQFLNRINIRKG